jgi:[protein-PII] uridylyltransferase
MKTEPVHYHPDRTQLCLVATGGYGRGELNPHSDIDLAFIPSEEDNPFLDCLIKQAFRLVVELFIDSTDLRVGYAYRPLDDLQHLDHQTVSSLLDARVVAGSDLLFATFQRELFDNFNLVGFVEDKINERGAMIRKGRASVYALEPNLKDGPGGLRDLHCVRWLAQAMYNCTVEQSFPELVRRSLASGVECTEATEALEFFWRVRNLLHLTSGKKEDVLVDSYQAPIARAMGYDRGESAGTQAFLADLYRRAERTHAFFGRVTQRLLDTSLPLDEYFRAVRHRIRLINPARVRECPGLLVRAFQYAQKYELRIDDDLETLIKEVLPGPNDWLTSSEARTAFLAILRHRELLPATLTHMHECGLLQKLLPEFHEIMYLAPPDPAHELTVGAHSLRALHLLCTLEEQLPEDSGPLREALAEIPDFELLALAVLMHDAGKADPHGDHAETGARLAASLGARLGWEPSRREMLESLVRHHLLLVRTSRLHDLDAPATLRRVASLVGDRDTLKMLYVLSHVDTRAVGKQAYTLLDLQLLDELYLKVMRALEEENPEYDAQSLADTHRRRLTRELGSLRLSEVTVRDLCERLPAAYVINTPLPIIAHDLTMLDRVGQERVIIDFDHPPRTDYTEMTVCAFDDPQPGLLSRVCGTLYANDVDIQHARVYTMGADRPVVLDTLRLRRDRHPLTARQTQRLEEQLRLVLTGQRRVEDLIEQAGKPVSRRVNVERIEFGNSLSDEHTVIQVVAEDCQGLLFLITDALAGLGLDIHSAKISSWAAKAEDAFYVTLRPGGRKVPDSELASFTAALIEALAGREPQAATDDA